MKIDDKYAPQQIEPKWYDYWMRHDMFHSEPDEREPYTVVIPPPNVTGMLHMGHMLNETIQDVLVRRARMQGKNACWVPGTDHASIATEAKVVQKLKAEGIDKSSLTREEFLRHAWEWKEKHGGIILSQLRKLGASCDWARTKFTMDPEMSRSVIKVFVDLYNKGKIYRGVRMVNWDPAAQTALSDEEVVYRESQGKLYYLRYRLEGTDRYLIVATTRPETILGDTALCVNPDDERYKDLPQDARVVVPLVGRSIPVIRDSYVDIEFGTGALKVTPAHDVNDYMLGEKYNLETIDIFNDDGTLNEHGGRYAGMDRFAVREQIERDLASAGLLEKVEAYTNNVGYSERTSVAIEPKLSMQWFPEDGRAVQTRIAGRYGRHGASGSLEVQERLPALDGERARLVHLAPAVVGSADSGLLSPDGRLRRGRNARAGAGVGPREKRQPGPEPARAAAGSGRARHVVLVMAVADLGIRRHQPPR